MANSQYVQSLLRGVAILEMLAESSDGLRLSEVAERLGVKNPTAHNLLRTLVSVGFATKTPGNLYGLGEAAAALGNKRSGETFLSLIKEALLTMAARLPGRVVVYCELDGDRVKTRYRIAPDAPEKIQEPTATYQNLYSNAGGLVFQAFAENEDQLLDLRENAPFHEQGTALWGTPERLRTFLGEAKAKGYALPPFDGQEFFRLAAPVYDRRGRLVGAIGASARVIDIRSEKDKTEMIAVVTQTAETLRKRVHNG